MHQIDEETSKKVHVLAEEGNVLLEDDNAPEAAIEKWTEALSLLPTPAEVHAEALWLYASIGEAWLALKNETEAFHAFDNAYRSPDGHLNPLVLLRLGEIHMRRDETDAAVKHLLRAYMLEGKEIFAESPDAFAYLKSHQSLT